MKKKPSRSRFFASASPNLLPPPSLQWLASSTCSDPSCKGVSLYNPLGGTTATDAVSCTPFRETASSRWFVTEGQERGGGGVRRKQDPSRFTDTPSDAIFPSQNAGFQIQYVVGSISGEIYWDELKVGGRTIPRQGTFSLSLSFDLFLLLCSPRGAACPA